MEITVGGVLTTIILILLCILINKLWKRRMFYYYASQIPGPISIPLIGNIPLLIGFRKNFLATMIELCKSQPPVFKIFLANHLIIVNSEPESLDILLNTFLEKAAPFYGFLDELIKNNLLIAPVNIWKNHRKVINQSFNPKILFSFHNIFVKYSKLLVCALYDHCDQEEVDFFSVIWQNNVNTASETLADIDFSSVDDPRLIRYATRVEEIFVERIRKPWLLGEFFWKHSDLRKEFLSIREIANDGIENILNIKKHKQLKDNELKNKLFLQNLIDTDKQSGKFKEIDIMDELLFMLVAASETVAVEINFVILMLGLHPEIQNRVYKEVSSITKTEDFSFEDTKKMYYTECVFKETTRLFPAAPFIARSIDQNFKLGSYVLPSGSHVIIPVMHIHRRPDLWRDPLKFDPDRFLPEEAAKRPRNAFLPFSLGPRNCIGLQYAMMNSKILIAYIVRHFTIKAVNYNRVEDIECEYHLLMKPKRYRVKLEKRNEL